MTYIFIGNYLEFIELEIVHTTAIFIKHFLRIYNVNWEKMGKCL